MAESIRVLVVAADADRVDLTAAGLERENSRFSTLTETDAWAALERLTGDPIDCVVAEDDVAGADGLELLEAVREVDESLPVVLYTDENSVAVASEALGAGATDYVRKGSGGYVLLANRIEVAVDQHRAKAALEREKDVLAEALSIADLGVCEYDLVAEEFCYAEGVAALFDLDPDRDSWLRDDVVFGDVLGAFHPEDRPWIEAAVDHAIETGEVTEFDARLDEDEERWLQVRCKPIAEGGEIRRFRATVRDVTDRVARERETASRERIMERIGLGVYALDAEGRYTYVNPACERITGYDEAEILGSEPDMLHPAEDVETFEATMADLLAEDPEGVRTIETSVRRNDGAEVPVDVVLTVLTNQDGTYAGSIGVVRDITEQLETERRLREYESILRAIPDEVSIADSDGRLVDLIPPTGSELTDSGYPPEELRGEHISKVMREPDVERAGELVAELVTTDREHVAFEMDVVTKDGELLPRENHLALLENDDGSIRGTVSVLRDIEERKRRERELERYARLIEASGDAVYALDTEGHFTFSNEAHQEIVDRPEEEVLGAHASLALPEEAVGDGQALIQELLDSDRRRGTYEMDILRPDGERIPTENHIALLTDEDGDFRGTVGVLRDISERKAHERELERQNERLERFAQIASHDLRNPLHLASGYLELVREEHDGENVQKLADALERMEHLIDDTLTMARQGATVGELEPVDLGELAAGCWAAVGADAGELTVEEPVTIRADETRARQVLENLFRNASEHGGEDTSVRLGAIGADGFYVADDGPGIPAGQRETVFEAGYSGTSEGTGFGLSIVAEIVEAHGWEIAVTESESAGARFEVTGVDVVW